MLLFAGFLKWRWEDLGKKHTSIDGTEEAPSSAWSFFE